MDLKEHIMDEIKVAMKSRDKERVSALRLIKADIQRYEVDKRVEVDDSIVIDILSKMLKQRRDSHSQYIEADRQELADQEAYEIEIIKDFLPKALSDEEVAKLIEQSIDDSQAQGMQDMGKVMGLLKPKLQGRADMGQVSKLLKEKLQS